jgi:hypothetical protein
MTKRGGGGGGDECDWKVLGDNGLYDFANFLIEYAFGFGMVLDSRFV